MMLVTLITLCVALWYLASHLLRGEADVTWHLATPSCDLHRHDCSVDLGEGRVLTLSVEAPQGIRALELLPLTVRMEGIEAQSVSIDFVGREMDMGLHRFALSQQDKGLFEGVGQVPICTESSMPWQARVIVETPAGRLGSRFDFTVERNSS